LTYLIGEIGVVMIFGSGAALLGFALIALGLAARVTFPEWLRWLTLIAGVASLTGLAFFPFFLLILWGMVIGVWLLVAGRGSDPSAMAGQPSPFAYSGSRPTRRMTPTRASTSSAATRAAMNSFLRITRLPGLRRRRLAGR